MERVADVVAEGPGVELAHGWWLHARAGLPPAEAELALREPAAAVPEAVAARLPPLRWFASPYIRCEDDGEMLSEEPGDSEMHSSLWIEDPSEIRIFLAFGDTSVHDAGFELLAVVGRLLAARVSDEEFAAYAALLREELARNVAGEIDEEALEAKEQAAPDYVTISLASTIAEYMHALWHDVEVREGPEHLDKRSLRRRFDWLAALFPANPGFRLFREH